MHFGSNLFCSFLVHIALEVDDWEAWFVYGRLDVRLRFFSFSPASSFACFPPKHNFAVEYTGDLALWCLHLSGMISWFELKPLNTWLFVFRTGWSQMSFDCDVLHPHSQCSVVAFRSLFSWCLTIFRMILWFILFWSMFLVGLPLSGFFILPCLVCVQFCLWAGTYILACHFRF